MEENKKRKKGRKKNDSYVYVEGISGERGEKDRCMYWGGIALGYQTSVLSYESDNAACVESPNPLSISM